MHKISVIVPIYNSEKYLEKCINSILNQKFKDIQLILVNDGSTDSSGTIAKNIEEKNKDRVIYLEKQNGGLSDARNYGIQYVEGDYIAFVDSDDYLSLNLFKDLEKYMDKNCDLIKFKILTVDENENIISENDTEIFEEENGEQAFNSLYKIDKRTEVAWGYLYKTEFWKMNKFKYAKKLCHEDFGLTPLIMVKASHVASTNIKGYYYVQTKNSMVRDNNEKAYERSKDLLIHYDNMIKELEKLKLSKTTKENLKIYYTNAIILSANNIQKKQEKNEYIREIKKRKMISNIKIRNFKQLLKRIILSINIKWYLKTRI